MIAPVEYEREFVYLPGTGMDRDYLFKMMWQQLPWEMRPEAPRRECWFNPYGEPYTYGSGRHARTYEPHSLSEQGSTMNGAWMVERVLEMMNSKFDSSYDCCFVNGYEHGRQHLGWHADDSPEMDMDHPIATVSIGAEREIWFRPKEDNSGTNVDKLTLADGSAAIMSAGMQRDWQHRIPKSSLNLCGPRISLTCRKLVRP